MSLEWDKELNIESDDVVRAVFYGLGADGTVGAQQKLDQDHRRRYAQLCSGVILSMIRKRPAL